MFIYRERYVYREIYYLRRNFHRQPNRMKQLRSLSRDNNLFVNYLNRFKSIDIDIELGSYTYNLDI